jgi:integrase
LYPVAWDDEYVDAPAIGDQWTPSVVGSQMSLIIQRARGQYRVLFALKAATGLRFGEILGLRIENVLDDCTRLCIIEKLWKYEQQDFLKTPTASASSNFTAASFDVARTHRQAEVRLRVLH